MHIISVNTNSVSESFIKDRFFYVLECLNHHPIVVSQNLKFEFNESLVSEKEYLITFHGNEFSVPRQNLIFYDKSDLLKNTYSFRAINLHSVENAKKSPIAFFKEGKFSFDIFECIFFHLSRFEERELKQSEYLGNKFEFEKQLFLIREGLEKTAVVDEIVIAFLEVLLNSRINVDRTLGLSHDIDYIEKFSSPFSIVRKIAGHLRHRKAIKGFSKLIQSYKAYLFKGEDGYDTFEWMLSSRDINKTIYFLMGGDHKEDNTYSLENPIFIKAVKLAKQRNYNIGIHPSYESWNSIELIQKQKQKLENVVGDEIVHSRQHFLNFDIEITPRILQEAGIKEDSSLGYTRYVGYRCGTAYPYKLYDFRNEKAFDVVERPLVFMDSAWLYESLRNNSYKIDFLDNCGGVVNFHNSMFDEFAHRDIEMKNYYNLHFGV